MSIPNRQIGWSNESNLLWQISKGIDKLTTTTGTSLSNIIAILNTKVGGSGTTNYVPKWTGTSVLGNSQIFDNGTNVGIGTPTPTFKLEVNGDIRATSLLLADDSISAKQGNPTSILAGYSGFAASLLTNSINWYNGTTGKQFSFIFPNGLTASQLTIPNSSGTIQLSAGTTNYFTYTYTGFGVDTVVANVKTGIKIFRFGLSFDLGEFVIEDLALPPNVISFQINSGSSINGGLVTQIGQTTLLINTIQYITGGLQLVNTITSFSANNLIAIGGLNASQNISSFSLPSLVYCLGGLTCNSTTTSSYNFNSLVYAGGLFISSAAGLTSISFPALVYNYGTMSFTGLTACTSISLPVLTTFVNNPSSGANLIALNSLTSLTNFSMPSIQVITSNTTQTALIFTSSTPNLTTFNIGTSLLRFERSNALNTGNWIMTSCALNQTSVDNILVQLAKLDGTNGTTLLSNRTITITGTSSAPSATGNAAKATLVARGCIVTTN